MIVPGSVTLILRTASGALPSGESEYAEERVVVAAIVAPGSGSLSSDSLRPTGVECDRTMYLPRSWAWRSLRGARVEVDGTVFTVVGDPAPVNVTAPAPTGWWPVAIPLVVQED